MNLAVPGDLCAAGDKRPAFDFTASEGGRFAANRRSATQFGKPGRDGIADQPRVAAKHGVTAKDRVVPDDAALKQYGIFRHHREVADVWKTASLAE